MIDLRASLEAVAVTGLTAIRVRVPFRRPFATATGMWLHREAWILFVTGPDGRIGVGEAVLEPDATEVEETILARLIREAADRATSGDVPDVEELELLGTPGRAFRAAMDAARLDLLPDEDAGMDGGRAAGGEVERIPVRTDAGSTGARTTRPGVPVNGTIGFGGPAAGAEAALQAIEAGFTTLKLKAGVERETLDLVARVRAIRTAVGPDIRLRLDVNGAWDLPTAEERLEAVARFAIEYAEQPLPADDGAGAAELRRRVEVPIAADEAAASIVAVRRLLAEGAADVLVVKPARVGGPVAVAEIAAAAAGHGVPVVVSTLFETGIGISAALRASMGLPSVLGSPFAAPLAHGLATFGLLEHDLLEEPLVVEDGWMRAPGGAGAGRLGVRVSRPAVARFAAEFVEATP
ncbi:MAG TPA: mandelate racemase/muconate lactonizing enzyme family protein [Verrucomicrobiae bacterium]|nr:mandelate racemase/muconate lactonizing enzyme family protein [Verrucomicrobiae bacterium]